jgi:hypothetical protein
VLPAALAARARPISSASSRLLPLSEPLVSLFPDRALRRGSTVVVAGARGLGTTTLALALLAAPSAAGSWCGIVGVPDPGVVAMAELGIDLGRVVLVPEARGGWVDAVGELAGGIDVLLVRPFGSCRPGVARRLVARARERQTALVVLVDRPEEWPDGPDLTLRVTRAAWRGIGAGHGHLQCRLAEVEASGRRSAARSVSRRLWLPSSSGTVADGDGPEQPV